MVPRVALALVALAWLGCARDRLVVKVVQQPGVAEAYSISCIDDRALCDAEAKRRCGRGVRTLDAGRGGYFRDEDGSKPPDPKPFAGGHFELREWIVACD